MTNIRKATLLRAGEIAAASQSFSHVMTHELSAAQPKFSPGEE